MRLVSYTRTTTCYPGEVISPNAITEQNEVIKAYAERHGWRVSNKYSDRKRDKTENEAFERLLHDGMQRKFDAVIITSIYRAGKDLWNAKEVLLQTFHYAGIGFIIVEDDFISIGKSNEEGDEFFREKYGILRREKIRYSVNHRNRNGILSWNDVKYGYRLTNDYQLVIDPTTAPVVKRMFEMCAAGMEPKDIAATFKSEHIPIPLVSRGMNVEIPDPYNWDRQTVRRLLDKTVYIGHWTKIVQGEEMHFNNEPIVDEVVFQKVQDYLASIATHAKPPRPKHRYNMMVKDKEGGFCLHLRHSKYGYEYFAFASTPKDYEGKRTILVSELEEKLRERLNREREKAIRMLDLVETVGDAMINSLTDKAQAEFERQSFLIAENEKTRMEAYKAFQAGESTKENWDITNRAARTFIKSVEDAIQEASALTQKEIQAISKDNPWINLFITWNNTMGFDRETLTKYVALITLDHMEIDSIGFVHQEWYMNLPKEWRNQNG